MNEQQLRKDKFDRGVIAVLEQSGGSTPNVMLQPTILVSCERCASTTSVPRPEDD